MAMASIHGSQPGLHRRSRMWRIGDLIAIDVLYKCQSPGKSMDSPSHPSAASLTCSLGLGWAAPPAPSPSSWRAPLLPPPRLSAPATQNHPESKALAPAWSRRRIAAHSRPPFSWSPGPQSLQALLEWTKAVRGCDSTWPLHTVGDTDSSQALKPILRSSVMPTIIFSLSASALEAAPQSRFRYLLMASNCRKCGEILSKSSPYHCFFSKTQLCQTPCC